MIRKYMLITLLIALVMFATGCSKSENPQEFYDKIKTGMTYDEVMQIMNNREPLSTTEGTTEVLGQKIEAKTVSWKVGNSVIVVIFEDGKVQAKDLTKLNP